MPQAIIGIGALIVIIAVMVTLSRRTRDKMRAVMAAEHEANPDPWPPHSGDQALGAMPPAKPRPTIQDLVDEEAAATGVNDIPGGEDLNVSLKLRVFWRDEVVRKGCADGHLEFRIASGVELDSIRTEDVRLVCVHSDSAVAPEEESPGNTAPAE